MGKPFVMNDDVRRQIYTRGNTLLINSTVTYEVAAHRLGVAKSTLGDFRDDHMERAIQVLAAFDMRVVHKDEILVSAEEKRALLKARVRMDQRELEELSASDTKPGDL